MADKNLRIKDLDLKDLKKNNGFYLPKTDIVSNKLYGVAKSLKQEFGTAIVRVNVAITTNYFNGHERLINDINLGEFTISVTKSDHLQLFLVPSSNVVSFLNRTKTGLIDSLVTDLTYSKLSELYESLDSLEAKNIEITDHFVEKNLLISTDLHTANYSNISLTLIKNKEEDDIVKIIVDASGFQWLLKKELGYAKITLNKVEYNTVFEGCPYSNTISFVVTPFESNKYFNKLKTTIFKKDNYKSLVNFSTNKPAKELPIEDRVPILKYTFINEGVKASNFSITRLPLKKDSKVEFEDMASITSNSSTFCST